MPRNRKHKTRILRQVGGELSLVLDLQNDKEARLAAWTYADRLAKTDKLRNQIVLAITCVGMDNKSRFHHLRRYRCCDQAGKYNGYGSGPTIFTCPNNCSCHD